MLLALAVTPATELKWRQISALAPRVQETMEERVRFFYSDASYTCDTMVSQAEDQGMRLPATLAGQYFAVFVCLLLPKAPNLIGRS
jgi:hypothetical protein